MTEFGDRLRKMREAKGLQQVELSRMAGMNDSYVHQLETGRMEKPGSKAAMRLAKALNISLDELLGAVEAPYIEAELFAKRLKSGPSGIDELKKAGMLITGTERGFEINGKSFHLVPRFDLGASAGPGALIPYEGEPQPIDFEPMTLDRAQSMAMGAASDLVILLVRGDSMEPTLRDGDRIVVDTSVRRIIREGVYVIALAEGLHVKRLSVHPLGKEIYIGSDNPHAKDWTIGPDESDQLHICGFVVWMSRRVN